ncbi:MAG: sensor histidine kinase [Synergistaceae bacterium]|jgi:two-component sensor histidine kinase|nr:sensor histidine kinase [Synergistaceae bacterium]
MVREFDSQYIIETCRRYTDFCGDDIQYLIGLAKYLPEISEVCDCSVYIEIRNQYKKDESIVLWEALGAGYKVGFLGEAMLRENEPAVFRTLDLGCTTKGILSRNQEKGGEVAWTRQSVAPIKRLGRTLGALVQEVNTSCQEEDSMEIKKLRHEQATLTDILISILNSDFNETNLLHIKEGILLFSPNGRLCYFNQGAERIYRNIGYRSIKNTHFDNLVFLDITFAEFISDKTPITKEFKVSSYYFRMRAVYADNDNINVIVVMEDISDYKNKSIELASFQNTFLEMQHKVRNNLQTIISLLRLQSRSCNSKETKKELLDGVSRIESIAATYEIYSDRAIWDKISLLDVLGKLRENVLHFHEGFYDVEIKIICPHIYLDSGTSMTVALIVNELLQNSFKHGFAAKKRGTITILGACEGNMYIISVTDDGAGLDQNAAKQFGSGFGSSIIIRFVEDKLEGKWEIHSGDYGAQFTFKFRSKH